MRNQNFDERVARKKARSTLEALFRAARLVNELALREARSQQKKGPPVRAAHTTLFPHIDFDGIRITELAEKVGTSKQAVSELVEELDEMGVVRRIPDPRDGRAKLVVFSRQGKNTLLEGLELLIQVEKQLARSLGQRKMLRLRTLLNELIELVTQADERTS